ncbi:MAG: hypothetical protein JXO22_04085, partial [Phycisphaerae bacterium]|nr:hypothetical protein [Phycisphaerae bacterium]
IGDVIGGRLNARVFFCGEPAEIGRSRAILNHGQAFMIAGVAILTAIMGVVLSPYGLENFTHPLKVAESDVWRTVGEWRPPFLDANYPPVGRFWAIYAIAAAVPLAVLLLRGFGRVGRHPQNVAAAVLVCRLLCIGVALGLAALVCFIVRPVFTRIDTFPFYDLDAAPRFASKFPYLFILALALGMPHLLSGMLRLVVKPPTDRRSVTNQDPTRASSQLFIHLFDLAAVALGIFMVLFARRFAPIFYILAAPALVVWLMCLWRELAGAVRPIGQALALAAVYIGIVLTAHSAWARADEQLVKSLKSYPGEWNLLDRVIVSYRNPYHTAKFLRENNLTPNVMAEWTAAAELAFEAPGVRVFIDGRAQQVYTEKLYNTYRRLMSAPPGAKYERETSQILLDYGTEAVVLRLTRNASRLRATLDKSPDWVMVFGAPSEVMYAAHGSEFLDELARRERAGDLIWPDYALTNMARGLLLTQTSPPDVPSAIRFWQQAVQKDVRLGIELYLPIARYAAGTPLAADVRKFMNEQPQFVAQELGLGDGLRAELQRRIVQCRQVLGGGQVRPDGRN